MKKLKIGVFGGYRGNTMINVLFGHDEAELVAVCDKVPAVLDNIRREAEDKGLDIALYSDFNEFIQHDMDAVVLANYANEHSVYALRCLERGLHVMSEVLPCETMAQAVELIEAVEKSGCVYTYAENYCYMQHAFEMQRRYMAGEIGEVMYIEGEYIHDCTSIWPSIAYGDPTHWRNRMHACFYCTHSVGPMLTITGRRPVQVVGWEAPLPEAYKDTCMARGAGIEIITLDNGAVARSIHGDLKREPFSVSYMVYGQKGMMESARFPDREKLLNVYRESDKYCVGSWESYDPEQLVAPEKAKQFGSHGGSDFYATHFFIEKILGHEDGKYAVDVYQAVDMGICGILGYRSVLNGNIPIKIPNLRNKSERDEYRHDNACTNPDIAGDELLPCTSKPHDEIPAEAYARHKKLYEEHTPLEYSHDMEFRRSEE